MRPAAALLAVLVPLAAAGGAPRSLRYDIGGDGALTAAAVAAWVGSEVAKPVLAPTRCRVCAPNRLDAGVREELVSGYGDRARHASDVLAFGLLPAGLAAHQILGARAGGDVDAGFVDLLLVAEAASLASVLNQAVKYAVGRERPFVHHRNWRDPDRRPDADDNLSFYSGHTTLAFSLAAASGTVSSLRGYAGAPWVWAGGLGAATAVGYLRIAADRHYLTDVLAGAALGTAIGIAVPRLLHGRERGPGASAQAATAPIPVGFAVAF